MRTGFQKSWSFLPIQTLSYRFTKLSARKAQTFPFSIVYTFWKTLERTKDFRSFLMCKALVCKVQNSHVWKKKYFLQDEQSAKCPVHPALEGFPLHNTPWPHDWIKSVWSLEEPVPKSKKAWWDREGLLMLYSFWQHLWQRIFFFYSITSTSSAQQYHFYYALQKPEL